MEQAFLFLGIKHRRIVFSSKFLMKKNQQFQVSVREKLSYSKFVICQTKALQVLGLREGFLRHSRLLENPFHSKKFLNCNIFARLHLCYGHLIFHVFPIFGILRKTFAKILFFDTTNRNA